MGAGIVVKGGKLIMSAVRLRKYAKAVREGVDLARTAGKIEREAERITKGVGLVATGAAVSISAVLLDLVSVQKSEEEIIGTAEWTGYQDFHVEGYQRVAPVDCPPLGADIYIGRYMPMKFSAALDKAFEAISRGDAGVPDEMAAHRRPKNPKGG